MEFTCFSRWLFLNIQDPSSPEHSITFLVSGFLRSWGECAAIAAIERNRNKVTVPSKVGKLDDIHTKTKHSYFKNMFRKHGASLENVRIHMDSKMCSKTLEDRSKAWVWRCRHRKTVTAEQGSGSVKFL